MYANGIETQKTIKLCALMPFLSAGEPLQSTDGPGNATSTSTAKEKNPPKFTPSNGWYRNK